MAKKSLKKLFFMFTHPNPNSLEGLKFRLENLREQGASEDSQGVVCLKAMIRIKESEAS